MCVCVYIYNYIYIRKKNTYIGYITSTLFHRFTYHLSENCAIKQHLII